MKKEKTIIPGTMDGLRELTLEVTRRCYLNCVHCYANAGPKEDSGGTISLEKWKSLMKEGRDLGATNLQISGGEPVRYKHIGELLLYARECGFPKRKLFTSAYVIPQELVEIIKETDPVVKVSFYSIIPEVHDRITTVEGSQGKVLENIEMMLKQGIRVRAGIVITPLNNFEGNVERTSAFLKSLGVTDIRSDYLVGEGRGADLIDDDGYARLLDETWTGKLAIDCFGNVYPYVMSRTHIVGDVTKQSLREIMESPGLMEYRENHFRMKNRGTKNEKD
jgi:MoaA/NifB/PqqE/SkfB family radical SAM enzyme